MMENDFNFDVLMNEYVRRNVVGGWSYDFVSFCYWKFKQRFCK
jgi:hypothetical protein